MTAFTMERVDSYRSAEELCPVARAMELQSFRDYLGSGSEKRVLELGSGNGTLTRCLREIGWTVDTVDIAFQAPPEARRHHAADIADGLGFLPKDAAYDAVVSLAVLHHVAACPRRLPDNLANDLAAVTRPGGILMLQDVPTPRVLPSLDANPDDGYFAAANTARIFAELVDPHSEPTHNGIYIEMAAIGAQLADEFAHLARFHHRCDWNFPNEEIAARYVQALFHLNLSLAEVAAVIGPTLQPAEPGLRLPWALDCLVMQRL
ncbi:MAG: class I SAM-dependent methyltransferase [Alphaproteobacteria bacterium]|jgi:SAM-dependent methyltransferase|nr:class I SAM-dependent methyltransferase [Alphaproteobacteria bacterium]MDP6830636.1 class I SAM-dependent methyltransferase [Alphaproteobacteria bacterium]